MTSPVWKIAIALLKELCFWKLSSIQITISQHKIAVFEKGSVIQSIRKLFQIVW
jgi:hypothetical protein